MSHKHPQLKIRLPKELLDYLVVETAKNASTKSSEVVRCVRERMERNMATQGNQSQA